MKVSAKLITLILLLAVLATACGNGSAAKAEAVSYTLTTNLIDGRMVFIGVGGDIDGLINPTLKAKVGDEMEIHLSSGEGVEHNIAFPDFNASSGHVSSQVKSTTLKFTVDKGGSFVYFCELPGHRQAGMEGKFEVSGESANPPSNTSNDQQAMSGMNMPQTTASTVVNNPPTTGADIVRDPTDLPAPIGDRPPTSVRIDLETTEIVGQLADGATFKYWTFNGKVPGPFFRVRLGDDVEVHIKNSADSMMSHSVDFHAVTGPGGGAVFTNIAPGQEAVFTFKAIIPGLFVYHCATPMVAEHIANGMYGLILVEPEGGLPKVDREFYVMQGEIYTQEKFGSTGLLTEDVDKLLDEKPEYFILNGAVGALTTAHPLTANVGETVRIFYGVGGPNYVSSFHVIGEMFDRVYDQASLTVLPLTDVQTTLVPPGGATMVEFHLDVPGRYILVDHALSRLQRGLAGYLLVEGPDQPDIFNGTPSSGSGH